MKLTNEWIVPVGRRLVWLAACLAPWAMAANSGEATDGLRAALTARVAPSPLLAIDQNRSTVVDRIVRDWGAALAQANAGIDAAELRELLLAMRADQLLAASLAGSLEGLRNVVAAAIVAESAVKPSLLQAKALGDSGSDLVYTPLVPCRIVDTRNAGGGGIFGFQETRNYHAYLTAGPSRRKAGRRAFAACPPILRQ